MMRVCAPMGLALAGFILSGCSNWHYADVAQWRQSHPAAADQSSRRVRTSSPSAQATPSRVTAARGEVVTTGTVGESRALKPWPKVGTPEWEQLQVEEIERERKVKEAVQSICRGC